MSQISPELRALADAAFGAMNCGDLDITRWWAFFRTEQEAVDALRPKGKSPPDGGLSLREE